MVWPFSLFPLQWSCQECIGVHLLEIILQDLMRLIRMWKKQGVESDWPSEVVARRSEPALQTGARVAAWERVAAGAGVEEASPDLQGFISGAFSSGRACGVSVPRLAPVPTLGWLVTHEGTATDRLELPAAEICSLLSGVQQQQPAGGCLLPPSQLQLLLFLIHYPSHHPAPFFLYSPLSLSP